MKCEVLRKLFNRMLHREDGSAVEHVDGSKESYLSDRRLTAEEFAAIGAAIQSARDKEEATRKFMPGLFNRFRS
jgi:hypothetical protein